MARDVDELLSRFLEDGALDETEAGELSQALEAPDVLAAAQAEIGTELLLHSVLLRDDDLCRSQDRLLAKAVLRAESRLLTRARQSRFRLTAWATAAALAVVVAAFAVRWLTRPAPYPELAVQGDFKVQPAGDGAVHERRALVRGDRVVAGPGGARLALGGYCELALAPETAVVIRGRPRNEEVDMVAGRLVSRVTPGQGEYKVQTPTGTLEVKGTEFVTTVEYPNRKGDNMNAKSAVVSVLVVAGVVGFNFGGEQGLLSVGASRVFAGEAGEASALPAGMKGFSGILIGTVVEKSESGFTLTIAKIEKTWPQNKAESPATAIGKTVSLRVRPQDKNTQARLASMEGGAEVAVGAIHQSGDSLTVGEVLVPVAELPALLTKWEAAAKERKAREDVRKREGNERGTPDRVPPERGVSERHSGNEGLEKEIRSLREENAKLKRQLEERSK